MVRIGIIGAGGISQANHIPSFQKHSSRCEVVAICDTQRSIAEGLASRFHIPAVYDNHVDMIVAEKPDAVLVATPNRFHYQPTLDALRSGCHVLCEKPLGMTGDEAYQMVSAAKEAGKVLQVGLQLRFGGPATFLLEYIKKGHMGSIYYARAQALRRRGVPSWGVFIDKDKQGGGSLIDIGVHILDLTLAAMGHPKPVTASACTWDKLGKNPDLFNGFGDYDRSKFTVEDFAAGFIRFENGAAITLESSFMANLVGNPAQTQLFGEKSGAILRPFEDKPLEITTERDRQLFDLTPANIPNLDPAVKAAEAFLDAIDGKAPCMVTGYQGYMLNAIFDAMYKSALTGKEEPVELKEVN